jgi:hypothetical protein
MTSIYLINIGANTTHQAKARSPIFDDGSWVYVSFPTAADQPSQEYSAQARPYLRNPSIERTHADPCWDAMTYGDNCANPRAGALRTVQPGDTLLFWGLLWRHRGQDWAGFTGEQGWYLFGAMRVEAMVHADQPLDSLSDANRLRASSNAHVKEGGGRLPADHVVFLGDGAGSARFTPAVDLEVRNPSGLLYRAFTDATGALLAPDRGPSWKSSLRSCRKLWDLEDAAARSRAQIVADAVKKQTGFDLLHGL